MKSTPAAPRGPDPYTVVHRRDSPDTARTRFACGAPFGRSGKGWGEVTCAPCLAAPPPAPAAAPVGKPRPRRVMPA